MTIRLSGFQGEFPKTSPRLLPDQAAQVAENVRLEDGALIPYLAPLAAHTFGSSVLSIYLNGASWLGWAAAGVRAAPGPIADDRLYVFGDGAPKMIYSGVSYDLALAAPAADPTVAIQASTAKVLLGALGSRQRYVFDGTNWSVEDATAEATLALDQVTAVQGELSLIWTGDSDTATIVALLPASPAAGDVIALVQDGEGRVRIHRNGGTIDGARSDTSLTTDTATAVALYHSSDWQIRGVGDTAQTITASTTVGAGSHVSVNSASSVTLTFPASPSVGDVISATRTGAGSVTLDGNGTMINGSGTFAIPTQLDRYVAVFNGTDWTALKIAGAFDANHLSIGANTVLTADKTYRCLMRSAPKVALVDLPHDAASADVVRIGRSGSRPLLVLPNGDNIDASPLPYEIATDNAFISFTFGGSGWTAAADATTVSTRAGITATVDTTVIAYARTRDITIKLPAAPALNDFVEIHSVGAYSAYVSPNGGAIYREPDEDTAEEILFAYTYVTSLDEESAPSPLSDPLLWSAGLPVLVSGFSAAPAGRLIDRIRIYRSQTSALGTTDLYFIAEITSATTSWLYDDTTTTLGEIIPSLDYNTPPAALKGIVTMPNGIMAAFRGRKIAFCEPYIPHAWPAKYELSVDYPIVGLAAFGSIIAVMTTGTPYIVQGTQPDSMSIEKVESTLPCLSADGIVDLGYAAAYPSPEGLVLIQPGGAQIVTRNLFTRQQWAALNPSSFKAGSYGGRYVFSYLDGASRKCGIIDLTGQQPFFVRTTVAADAMFTDPRTGNLYVLTTSTQVSKWDAGASPLTMRWKSKEFRLPHPINYGAMRLEAERRALVGGESVSIKVYADGVLIHTEITYGTATRLPSGVLSDSWEVQIEGTLPVSMLAVAETMPRLAMG